MATAISSRRRHLVLSYSSFDVVESQEHYPASLLLRIYRLLEGDQSLDYSDLLNFLGQPVGYCSQRGEESLDEVEWWLYQALEEKLQDSTVVEECYTNIKRGRTAARARQESEPTVYDGALNRVDIPVSPWIPRKPLSCSQLEYLATCPFGYFLRYALQLEPPKDLLYDPSRWLDPLQRGNLLHSVFCDFMRKIIKSGERVDEKRHKNLIYQIALQLIDIYKEQIPIPSELVFQCEVNEILESCDFFLAIESRRESTPLFFEVPFGLGEKEATKAGCGLAEPIRLDLGHGRILSIRGRIDRIDRISEDCYSVWDYKTGKGLSQVFLTSTAFTNHLFSFETAAEGESRFRHQTSTMPELIQILLKWIEALQKVIGGTAPAKVAKVEASVMKYCGQCGTELRPGKKFCTGCGTPI
jgi:ATP-dependent helicase/DNAse subunit B